MKHTLYKAILKSRSTPIITLSLSIIGIYAGYLIWYVLGHYLPGTISDYRVFVSILAIWISAFIAIYKIPDQLFTNRRIKDVLCFPLSSSRLVLLVIGRLACLQLGVIISAFWSCFLYATSDWPSTVAIILFCWISSCLIDLLVLLMSTAIGNLLPASSVGYGFIVLQYGAFLLLALSAGNLVSEIFFVPDFLDNLNEAFCPDKWLLIAMLVAALSTLCAYFCVKADMFAGI